jgi:lysine 6-dehydrogenase
MKAIVFGAGMMGSALAYDLAHSENVESIVLADIDYERASRVAKNINPKVMPIKLNLNYIDQIIESMVGMDVAIGAVSYNYNYLLTNAAIEIGIHFLDLGGNNDVVKQQLLLNRVAADKDVCVLPNCGLAPGLVNILAVGGTEEFDTIDSIHLRVGGLPQHPQPPLNYQIVFSAEGLINEYVEPTEVIRNGNIILVYSLQDVEEIIFPEPYGALEAFNTSGGISTLCHYLQGKVRELDYKTIRYKGHCEKFKILLDLGFASNEPIMIGNNVKTARELFTEMLEHKLDYKDTDVILLRAIITGSIKGKTKTLAYELIDLYDNKTKLSAMKRTTAFPTSIIAQMLANGEIKTRGVIPPENCVSAERLIEELKKRDVIISKKFIEDYK